MIPAGLWSSDDGDRGVLAPGRWFRLRAAIWMAGLFAFAAVALFASFQLADWLRLPAGAGYPVAILVPAAALVLYALAVRIAERRNATELALRTAPASLALGWVIGFSFMALSLAVLWILGLNAVALGHWHRWLHYLVFNAYVSAVVEELGFRAILLRLFARMFGPIPALFISAGLFALAHASHAPPLALALLVINGGLLLGVLYMVSGNLWLPIGAHLAYDFTEWSLFGVGDKDGYLVVMPSPQHGAWLTGGGFGPDGSVLSALVAGALIVLVLAVARRRAGSRGLLMSASRPAAIGLSILALAFLVCATFPKTAIAQAADVPARPAYGPFGVDLSGMDLAVKPGDDFYRYVNGGWLARTNIPADKAEVGAYRSLSDTARIRVQGLLEQAAKRGDSKIGTFYASYMDETGIQARGLQPIDPTLARIESTPDRAALAKTMAQLQREGVTGLFAAFIFADSGEPSAYGLYFEQAGLGLPDRHFYLDTDKESVAGHDAYVAYATRLLTLAGRKDTAQRVAAVMAFEARIADAQWDEVQGRDQIKTYNRIAETDLQARFPGLDWRAYLAALGVADQAHVIIREPSAFAAASRLWSTTPLPVLKDWLSIRVLDQNAPYLPAPFVDAHFAFHEAALSGIAQQRPRPVRAATLITHDMASAVGQAYVAAVFPPRAKAQIDAIVANVKAAFRARLAAEDWMAPETRHKAIAKLDTFQVVVGFPDRWRDDSGLEIRAGDLVGNVARAERYSWDILLARLGKRVDRREFDYSPAATWAWATPTLNEIGFSAAFLQPPYFDPEADAAVNYGAVGAVIGHELSHHFDDQGRLHDADGRLADWWTPEDVRRFKARAQTLITQYDAYEPLPGLHVNGALTLGENLADLAGLNISYQAYLQSLHGAAAPVLEGFTGPQRFFLGFAQSYRSKQRDADLRNQVLSDPHPPEQQRAEEVRNIDAWYDAFQVRPGDKLYLAPEQRVRIW